MTISLFLLYYLGGLFMATIACAGIGFFLAALLALVKSVSRSKNLLWMVAYGAAAGACYCFLLDGLDLAEWIGDRTHYSGQSAMLIGAIFPGIFFALSIIRKFLAVAAKQISGIHVE